jgi:hypothetical protein
MSVQEGLAKKTHPLHPLQGDKRARGSCEQDMQDQDGLAEAKQICEVELRCDNGRSGLDVAGFRV